MHRYVPAALLALLGFAAAPAGLAAQDVVVEAGPVTMDISGRVHVQFNTTSVDADSIAFSTFETRRVRLALELTIDDWITGKLQPDFALGRIELKDVWLNFAFGERFELRVGQFKKPFSLIELSSTSKIPVIENGVRIRGVEDAFRAELEPGPQQVLPDFNGDLVLGEEQYLLDVLGYIGRDIGVAVHGRWGRLAYAAGVFNGNGADERDRSSGKSLAARLEYAPLADAPLVLGAAASFRELRFDGELNGVAIERSFDGVAVEVDAEWGAFRRPGLHVLAEAVVGENYVGDVFDGPGLRLPGFSEDPLFAAAQAIVTYFWPLDGDRVEGIEPVGRISLADPHVGGSSDAGWLLTPGVNLYFFGRNRLMLNWDVFLPDRERFDTEHALRVQANLYF